MAGLCANEGVAMLAAAAPAAKACTKPRRLRPSSTFSDSGCVVISAPLYLSVGGEAAKNRRSHRTPNREQASMRNRAGKAQSGIGPAAKARQIRRPTPVVWRRQRYDGSSQDEETPMLNRTLASLFFA